jgi:hypothetical protein
MIVFTGNPDSTLHPDRRQGGNNIYMMGSDGSGFRKFLSMDGFSLGNPQYSPDGKMISFSASPDEPRGFSQTQIGIVNVDGSNPRIITGNFYRVSIRFYTFHYELFQAAHKNPCNISIFIFLIIFIR